MTRPALNADQRGGFDLGGKRSFTVEQAATQLTRAGLSWSASAGQSATVTYAFRSSAPDQMPDDTGGFQQLSSQQIAAVERALAAWSQVAGITFVRVGTGVVGDAAYSNDATILFGGYSRGGDDAAAFAFLPGSTAASSRAGDVWINQTLTYMRFPGAAYEPGYLTLVHEIGHAIGLLHPGDYDGDGNITYAASAAYLEDSLEYSVMSYFDLEDTGGSVTDPRWWPAGPLIDDIAAAQRLYGPNITTNGGDTVYGSNPYSSYLGGAQGDRTGLLSSSNLPLWGTIWDGGGTDTLDFGGSDYAERIDLRPGAFSDVQGGVGTLSIALGVLIENAVGGNANDVIVGNSAANGLFGGPGDDVLTGGPGDDLLDGGIGSDRAVIASTFAGATFLVGDNGDTIVTSADGRDALRNVEAISFADRLLQVAPVVATDGLYRTFMGRAAGSTELGYWLGQFDLGKGTADIRMAILADPAGHAHTVDAVNAIYLTQIGRAAGSAELGYWEAQVKGGIDFAAVRGIVAADPAGRAHAADLIANDYRDYLGRAPSAGETAYWGDRIAGGLTVAQLHAALASDASSARHVQQQIVEAYSFGLGRTPGAGEISFWSAKLREGLSLHDMRATIANDTSATGASDAAVKTAYQDYMGRAPSAAELSYWNGQARGGAGLGELRAAILSDATGGTHAASVVSTLYGEYFGRAPSAGEQATWTNLFRDGVTPDTLRVTLLADPGSRDTVRASASALNSLTTLAAGFTHAVVTDFRNFQWGPDPYGGASVPPPPDRDVLDLRATPFAGINPLAFARDVVDLNGVHGVLISYDGHHDILLPGASLTSLNSGNFMI